MEELDSSGSQSPGPKIGSVKSDNEGGDDKIVERVTEEAMGSTGGGESQLFGKKIRKDVDIIIT